MTIEKTEQVEPSDIVRCTYEIEAVSPDLSQEEIESEIERYGVKGDEPMPILHAVRVYDDKMNWIQIEVSEAPDSKQHIYFTDSSETSDMAIDADITQWWGEFSTVNIHELVQRQYDRFTVHGYGEKRDRITELRYSGEV